MGSEEGCLQPNGFHLNGLLPDKSASVTRVLDLERWTRAEERTAELIALIQPDWPSWEHRGAVASYVRRLIKQSIPCVLIARIQPDWLPWERRSAIASYVQRLITQSIPRVVFSYGSVPLKTYLPDGDIDLTVFSQDSSCSDNWAAEVRDVLEKEERNDDAEYRIREVQLIHAEVKLVKCLVDDFVMDISFSQLGGLCTLCFLEQVDRYINQDHLFKRSIILIKAWCYYESRLLGAYHGLISTYALETMILYIFHVFNNSFAGPLEVLYRFLEFFSKFDWDNFCLSLLGPVPVRSLPNMTADPPRNDCDELLLSKVFLDTCSFNYSAIPSIHELKEQFVSKNLNIIDFLRANNNLGRSVSRGNFFRIRSAFAFGAQRLAGLLGCPKEHIVTEINHFFVNTWDRHGKADHPDKCIVPVHGIVRDNLQDNFKKGNGTGTNSMISKEGNTRVEPPADGEVRRSKISQNGAQFVHQLSRTSSSPELTNASSELLRGGLGGRLQNNSVPKSDNSGKTGEISASRERSLPDVDVCSSSASIRCPGDYKTGEGIVSGVKPVPNSVNAMRSSWKQALGRQYELPAFVGSYVPPFPAPEALGSLSFHHCHHLASVPLIRRFNDLVPEGSRKQLIGRGFCDHGVDSSRDYGPENGLFCSKDTEKKQSSDSFATGYDSSDQAKVCSYYEVKKQHELDIENGESAGKHIDGVKSSCSSIDTLTTEVSSGNSLARSSLVISGDSLGDRVGSASTVGPRPVVINSNQCQSQANDIGQISHEVTGQMPAFSPEVSSYPTTNLVVPSFHPQSWPLAANGYPMFPVTFFPSGPVFPSVGTLPCLTYISQCEGKGATDGQCASVLGMADSVDQSNNSRKFAQHSEESTSDILSGDFLSHLNNMLYGRSCQNQQFQSPLVYQPSAVPTQFLQGQFRSGDPGTPSSSSAGDAGLPVIPLVPISHHYPNQKNATSGYQRYPKVNPRNGMGTGTYLPHQEGFRDVQSSTNSRYYKRNQRNHRKEKHREQELNSGLNSRPRYADRSRQWEKPNPRFESSTARNDRAQMEWKAYGRNSHPTYQSMGYAPTYMVYSCDPNSAYGPLEHHPADYANSSQDQPPSPSF